MAWKNEGGDRFLVIFKTFKNFWKICGPYVCIGNLKNKEISQKLNGNFEFYKNWLVVCT